MLAILIKMLTLCAAQSPGSIVEGLLKPKLALIHKNRNVNISSDQKAFRLSNDIEADG